MIQSNLFNSYYESLRVPCQEIVWYNQTNKTEDDIMSLGNRIKLLRKQKKMTQSDLTEGFLTKGTLSLIENDKTYPSVDTLQHIAQKLGVTISYLTQQGDESWTDQMAEHFKDYHKNFPYEEIEEKIIPNIERIFTNDRGVFLLTMLRYYYRIRQDHDEADKLHQIIYKRLDEMGLKHLAVHELINHSLSKLYSLEYEDALNTLESQKEQILSFTEYDSRIEIAYYYAVSILASAVEKHDLFIKSSKKVEELSFKTSQFQYYFDIVRFMVLHYTFTEDDVEKAVYIDKVNKFLEFSPDPTKEIEFRDSEKLYTKYDLINQPEDIVSQLTTYRKKLNHVLNEYEMGKDIFYSLNLKIIDQEIAFFQGNYEEVIKNHNAEHYDFKQASHPIDRISLKTRSLVFALSLFYTGRIEEARHEVDIVVRELGPLLNSIYADEICEIKQMIQEN